MNPKKFFTGKPSQWPEIQKSTNDQEKFTQNLIYRITLDLSNFEKFALMWIQINDSLQTKFSENSPKHQTFQIFTCKITDDILKIIKTIA